MRRDLLREWCAGPRGRVRARGLACGLVLFMVAVCGCTAAASPSTGSGSSTSSRGFTQAQTAQGYTVTLRVSPDKFGTNTFLVTLKNAQGTAVNGAGVQIATQMLDMDMGVQTAHLTPTGVPGEYSGQSDLTMAGHWEVFVHVVPPSAGPPQAFDFRFSTSY
jgi:hypothetical protein